MPIELLWIGGVLVAALTTLIVALLPDKQNAAGRRQTDHSDATAPTS